MYNKYFASRYRLLLFLGVLLSVDVAIAVEVIPARVERKPVLNEEDSNPFDDYGISVAYEGDTVFIGAPFDDALGVNSGAVYVYSRNNNEWIRQQKITASDLAPGDQFGWSVALSGNTALISARFDDDKGFNSGSVYVFVFEQGRWREETKLTASDGNSTDQFGHALALQGDSAVISAPYTEEPGTNAGAVYIFDRSGGVWHEKQRLAAPDAASDDQYGGSLALDENHLLIGSRFDDDKGYNSGSVHFYELKNGVWQLRQKLTADDGDVNDQFGWSVALNGNTAVIGARFDDDGGVNSGSVYFAGYEKGKWAIQQKFTVPEFRVGARYGWSVQVEGGHAVVGAPFDNDRGQNAGAVYIYSRREGAWYLHQKLTASDASTGERYGIRTAISGGNILVGAYQDYEKGALRGASYVQVYSTKQWRESIKLLASDGAGQ
jgi:hypothetical protein